MTHKLLRLVSFAICLLMLLLIMSGCVSNQKESGFQYTKEEMQILKEQYTSEQIKTLEKLEAHLYNKYGKLNYNRVFFENSHFMQQYDLLTLSIDIDGDGSSEEFTVKGRNTDSGYEITDTFFGLTIKSKYQKAVEDCASKYFDDFFVDAEPEAIRYPNKLTGASTYEDLINMKDEIDDVVPVIVIVKNNYPDVRDFEEDGQNFCIDWGAQSPPTMLRVILVDPNVYDSIDKTNYMDAGVLVTNKVDEVRINTSDK